MNKFLIDANLPWGIDAWQGENFIHVADIDDQWTDSEIWDYAKKTTTRSLRKTMTFRIA